MTDEDIIIPMVQSGETEEEEDDEDEEPTSWRLKKLSAPV